MYITCVMWLGVGGASDAKPVSGVSVASSGSCEYNELQMKCKAYQEELTEVQNYICIMVMIWCHGV